MSSKPACAKTSASAVLATAIPRAPAPRWRPAIVAFLCVLLWGRRCTPAASPACWPRVMLPSNRSTSTSSAGVSSVPTLAGGAIAATWVEPTMGVPTVTLPTANCQQLPQLVRAADLLRVERHPHRQAAVGHDQRSGDVARALGGEEVHHLRDVGRLPQRPQGGGS